MKDKYIESRFPIYFIFGEHRDGIHVDIATTQNDTIVTVTREEAERLIRDRNRLVDTLCRMARAFEKVDDKAFMEFWYGN